MAGLQLWSFAESRVGSRANMDPVVSATSVAKQRTTGHYTGQIRVPAWTKMRCLRYRHHCTVDAGSDAVSCAISGASAGKVAEAAGAAGAAGANIDSVEVEGADARSGWTCAMPGSITNIATRYVSADTWERVERE